jgi:hypothetical protein
MGQVSGVIAFLVVPHQAQSSGNDGGRNSETPRAKGHRVRAVYRRAFDPLDYKSHSVGGDSK